MISNPKPVANVDAETDPIQNNQDPEADSEEEHVADEPGAGGEHVDIVGANFVSAFSTAQRPGKIEEEKEET